MIKKLIKVIKQPKLLLLFVFNFKLFRLLPDSIYLKIKYKFRMNKKLVLSNPLSFSEKLQWLKLNDQRPEYTKMVDKYGVRQYISETIGDEFLIPLLGVYKNYDEIDFDSLPNQFVLKPNHTSGDVYICKDKSKIDHGYLKGEIKRWLNREYYWPHREWPYKNVEPLIICEEFLMDQSEAELKDFKLMCFNGQVKCIFVCLNRNSAKGVNIDIYDTEWKLMPFERENHPNSGIEIPKPKTFNDMVSYAEKLSNNIPFLRVDFYEVNGKLYFGELTFYPSSGFEGFTPDSYDYVLGDWLSLPTIIK